MKLVDWIPAGAHRGADCAPVCPVSLCLCVSVCPLIVWLDALVALLSLLAQTLVDGGRTIESQTNVFKRSITCISSSKLKNVFLFFSTCPASLHVSIAPPSHPPKSTWSAAMSVHFDSNCLPSPPVTPSSELETALVYACLLSEVCLLSPQRSMLYLLPLSSDWSAFPVHTFPLDPLGERTSQARVAGQESSTPDSEHKGNKLDRSSSRKDPGSGTQQPYCPDHVSFWRSTPLLHHLDRVLRQNRGALPVRRIYWHIPRRNVG